MKTSPLHESFKAQLNIFAIHSFLPTTSPVSFNIVYELSDILDDLIPDRLFVVAIRTAAVKLGLVKDHQQSPSFGVVPPLSGRYANGQQPSQAQPNTIGVFTSTPMFGRLA